MSATSQEPESLAASRIHAKQAVIVAAITAVSSILVTLIATGVFSKSPPTSDEATRSSHLTPRSRINIWQGGVGLSEGVSAQQCLDHADRFMVDRNASRIARGSFWASYDIGEQSIEIGCMSPGRAQIAAAGFDEPRNRDIVLTFQTHMGALQ